MFAKIFLNFVTTLVRLLYLVVPHPFRCGVLLSVYCSWMSRKVSGSWESLLLAERQNYSAHWAPGGHSPSTFSQNMR
jgi:hypothetical protein